jgi:hypothetical protein
VWVVADVKRLEPQQELQNILMFSSSKQSRDFFCSAEPLAFFGDSLGVPGGKDVYIEKPTAEIWEAAKWSKLSKIQEIVSLVPRNVTEALLAFEWIHAGNLGAIKWVREHAISTGLGTNGIVTATNRPKILPETIHYDLWCGWLKCRRYTEHNCVHGTGFGTQVAVISVIRDLMNGLCSLGVATARWTA